MTKGEHLRKAAHNELFVASLKSAPEFYDWMLTGTFYAAVHYVEAALADHGHHSFDHADRGRAVGQYFGACYKPFRQLKDLSISARYQCITPPPADFERHLRAIKRTLGLP